MFENILSHNNKKKDIIKTDTLSTSNKITELRASFFFKENQIVTLFVFFSSKATMTLRYNGLLGVNQTFKGTGNPTLTKNQGIELYSCSRNQVRSMNLSTPNILSYLCLGDENRWILLFVHSTFYHLHFQSYLTPLSSSLSILSEPRVFYWKRVMVGKEVQQSQCRSKFKSC